MCFVPFYLLNFYFCLILINFILCLVCTLHILTLNLNVTFYLIMFTFLISKCNIYF